MSKIILDQNVLNSIVDDEEFHQLFDWAKESGLIEPVFTHVHLDQSNPTKDIIKRDKMLLVINSFGTTVTYAHVDGLSRPGWSSSAPSGTLEEILGNQTVNDKNTYDALLASTAFHEAAIFVTDDKRLKNRCLTLGKQTMSGQEFKSYLKEFAAKEKFEITSDPRASN
jgi:hypothetical protein